MKVKYKQEKIETSYKTQTEAIDKGNKHLLNLPFF